MIDLKRALYRGEFMKVAAAIESTGIPINKKKLLRLNSGWDFIQSSLIAEVDSNYNVYEGNTFKAINFREYLYKARIPWPVREDGTLELDDATFKYMARAYPALMPLYQLRVGLAQMRKLALSVGTDERNRVLLSPFALKTGRNSPSSNRFIFGNTKWLRGLIEPKEGHGCAYIDWSQQEIGIAGALSGDPKLQEAYRTGDSYLAFAKQAKLVPVYATKDSHPVERARCKQCKLAVQYGGGAKLISINMSCFSDIETKLAIL